MSGAAALMVGLCVIAFVVGVAVAMSAPPSKPSPLGVASCGRSCWGCAHGDVLGCFACGTCARYLPR